MLENPCIQSYLKEEFMPRYRVEIEKKEKIVLYENLGGGHHVTRYGVMPKIERFSETFEAEDDDRARKMALERVMRHQSEGWTVSGTVLRYI